MRFCTQCGHAVRLLVPEGDNRERHVCIYCETIHYLNPKNVVGILPVRDGKILLCKRAIEPQFGKWTIPSGFMENDESLEEGAMREAMEEAGIQVEIQSLHTTYSIPHINQVYILFLAEVIVEGMGYGHETSELMWVLPEEIPWDDIAFSAVKACLERYINM